MHCTALLDQDEFLNGGLTYDALCAPDAGFAPGEVYAVPDSPDWGMLAVNPLRPGTLDRYDSHRHAPDASCQPPRHRP